MSTDARVTTADRSVGEALTAVGITDELVQLRVCEALRIPGRSTPLANITVAGTLPLRDAQQAVIQAAERYADHADRLGNVPCLPDCPSRLRLIAAVAALRAANTGEDQ